MAKNILRHFLYSSISRHFSYFIYVHDEAKARLFLLGILLGLNGGLDEVGNLASEEIGFLLVVENIHVFPLHVPQLLVIVGDLSGGGVDSSHYIVCVGVDGAGDVGVDQFLAMVVVVG